MNGVAKSDTWYRGPHREPARTWAVEQNNEIHALEKEPLESNIVV